MSLLTFLGIQYKLEIVAVTHQIHFFIKKKDLMAVRENIAEKIKIY